MYFAVSKFLFDVDSTNGSESKLLAALAEKLRQRFKVSARPILTKGGELGIALAWVSPSENGISLLTDKIAKVCEESGIGRIESESTLIDTIDSIEEQESLDQ